MIDVKRHSRTACLIIFLSCFGFCLSSQAQDTDLSTRVQNLEERVKALEDFAQGLQKNLEDYSRNLQNGLAEYSKSLQANLDEQLRVQTHHVAVLDLLSKQYQRVDSNSGIFLIAVQNLEKIKSGYRLSLSIGNPNAAKFSGFSLRVRWGSPYSPSATTDYQAWHASLGEAEYSFESTLVPGRWQDVQLEIPGTETMPIGYLECEMDVKSVELQTFALQGEKGEGL